MKHLSILYIEEQSSLSTFACIVGAYQIFTEANAVLKCPNKEPKVKIELVSVSRSMNNQNEIFSIKPHTTISEITQTDLIVIPASLIRSYETATKNNQLLIKWVEQQYKQGAEVASMCAGGFMLAATGLLDGRNCSTHWKLEEEFRQMFPNVTLQTDKLITYEKGIFTNGGAYSFLNLLIYLIEKYYDRQTAIYCAKVFQIDIDRRAQSAFSIFSGHKKHDDDIVLQAQSFIEKHFQDRISIEKLSANYNVGRRNFDRRFIKATGITPLDYLQRVKIEAAKQSFENTRKTVNEVMYDVGYNDSKAFREVFSRVTGMSPIDYKLKYNKES